MLSTHKLHIEATLDKEVRGNFSPFFNTAMHENIPFRRTVLPVLA